MDQAREQTDKILNRMEKKVSNIYKRASNEISDKWNKYMKSHEGKVKSAYDDLQEALKSGDKDAIKSTKEVYERTVKNVTLNDSKFRAMVKETTAKLANTNEVALNYVNDNMAKIYTLNYNEFGNQDISGYTFTLVNEQAVKNLAKEDKLLLPAKKLDIPKDKAWNTKSINAEVLQGILQGENIPKIAQRLSHVTDMNTKSAIRNARTMVTSAENKGRQDSFKKAESDGVIMKRRWVAAHDDRTRAWHSDLDGVEVDVDEPWDNDYGEIMYPGDPTAHPGNVYNCRCSIRSIVKGFKWNQEEEERYIDLSNVVDFDGKETVIESLNNMNSEEARVWNDYIQGTEYKLITEQDHDVAFYTAGTHDVNLFSYSTNDTFFHETAHALDDDSVIGTMEMTGKRKLIGSNDWVDSNPIRLEINGASNAADQIFGFNENAWAEDHSAFIKWAGMKDEDDLQSLIHAVRSFASEYGDEATGVLGDLIDAHTLGKYPMSVFAGGHGAEYWNRDAYLIPKEAWAEISSLRAIGKDKAVEALSEILPNRVNSTNIIYDLVFTGGKPYEHKLVEQNDHRISETVWRFRKKS